MADEQRTLGSEEGETLLERLEAQIRHLEEIDAPGSVKEQILEAVTELRKETDVLRMVGPHIFAIIPKR